jgi:hypothetical protein
MAGEEASMHFLASAALSTVLASGVFTGEVGSGVVKEESRQLPAFHRVRVSRGLEADVTQGGKTSVVVRGDDNLLHLVRTEVADGELTITAATEEAHGFSSKVGLKVIVTTPALDGVEANSGGRMELTNPSGSRLDVRSTSGGEVRASGVAESALLVEATGGGVVRLAGKAKDLRLECSGGASVKAGELAAESVRVESSGGAAVDVNATASLKGNLSSGSALKVRGAPAVREVATSSGASYQIEGAREL